MFGLIFALLAGCSGGQNDAKVKAATAAAEKWLSITDEGRYGETWDEASAYFKNVMTRDKWETVIKATREPLGKFSGRTLKACQYLTTVPGMPAGEYVLLEFSSNTENAMTKEESITMMLETDGNWRPSSYFVK